MTQNHVAIQIRRYHDMDGYLRILLWLVVLKTLLDILLLESLVAPCHLL